MGEVLWYGRGGEFKFIKVVYDVSQNEYVKDACGIVPIQGDTTAEASCIFLCNFIFLFEFIY